MRVELCCDIVFLVIVRVRVIWGFWISYFEGFLFSGWSLDFSSNVIEVCGMGWF